jgi:hypothetical protein
MVLQLEITARCALGKTFLFFFNLGPIIPYLQCITHAHEATLGGELLPWLEAENLAMTSLQTSDE